MPKVTLHLFCHPYLPAVIVDGRIRKVGVKRDAVLRGPAGNAPPEPAGIYQNRTSGTCRAFTPLPCLGEKSLTLKITVELICHLHPDILQDPGDYLLHVLVHSHRH